MSERTYGGYTAEQIKAAAQGATPGPWRVVTTTFHSCVASEHGMIIGAFGMANYGEDPVNGTYIAASNPAAVLDMLARIAELEGENARLHTIVEMAVGSGVRSSRVILELQAEIAALREEPRHDD